MFALGELQSLIVLDERQLNPDKAWKALTDWSRLFDRLQDAVVEVRALSPERRNEVLQTWERAATEWHRYWSGRQTIVQDDKLKAAAKSATSHSLRTWSKFRLFMLAAIRAATIAPSLETADLLSDVLFNEGGADLSEQEAAWVRTCGRLLLPGRFVFHRVAVVVPMIAASKPPSGYLALLELTVLRGGENNVCLHPRETTETDSSFPTSMKSAWSAALSLPSDNKSESSLERQTTSADLGTYDGVWRLLRLAAAPRWSGEPIASVEGSSAGGAAVRGWWHALHKKHPDDEVAVIAAVKRNTDGYTLAGVESGAKGEQILAKISAVASDSRLDTVVMVDDASGNRRFAESLLRELRPELRHVWLSSEGGDQLAGGVSRPRQRADPNA